MFFFFFFYESGNKTFNVISAATWQNQQNECAPSEDSDQPGHPPSLIKVFAVRAMGSQEPRLSSCGQRRLWSGWAYTHFVGFVMSRLITSANELRTTGLGKHLLGADPAFLGKGFKFAKQGSIWSVYPIFLAVAQTHFWIHNKVIFI